MVNNHLNEFDLTSVIDAIKRASDSELLKLTEISNKLDASGHHLIQAPVNGPITTSTNRNKRRNKKRPLNSSHNNEPRSNEIEISVLEPDIATQTQAISTSLIRMADNASLDGPDTLADMPAKIEQAVKDGLSQFDGYWKDQNGRLRREDGKYASKAESNAYTAAEVSQQRQQERAVQNHERQTNAFAQFTHSLKQFTSDHIKSTLDDDNDATETAGAAAGGSFFYSAKEIYSLGKETKTTFDDVKKRFTSGSVEPENQALANDSKAKKISGINRDKSLTETNVQVDSSSSNSSNAPINELSKQKRSSVEANNKDSQSVTSEHIANAETKTSKIKTAKDAQYKAEHIEVLREQSYEQKKLVDDILDKLDDINSTLKSSTGSGDGAGLLDFAGDLFDRKGRRGRGRGAGSRGRGAGGRMRSVLSRSSAGVSNFASKGMSMAGSAFKGLGKMASVAGKAVPFLAPALMAYDAVSGFTDTEKQKEVFNLKEGQEATTGQKSSLALANVLDLGGLVSGTAGLVGSALGAVGFDDAEKALDFDAGDIAKNIYSFFTGGSDDKASADDDEKVSLAKAQEQERKAVERELTALEREVEILSKVNDVTVASSSAPSLTGSGYTYPAYNVVAQPATINTNERVSTIKAQQQEDAFRSRNNSDIKSVKLDEDTMKRLTQTNNNTAQTSAPVQTPKQEQTANSPARSTGDIPTNFTDRSLQRQSADLE